jgi:pyrrolidone-carboxylate peptidase
MDNILGFAFKENISAKTFIEKITNAQPKLILGLGMYSRRDKDKLRIETQCKIDDKSYAINYFLNPISRSKLAKGIGNSYCNYISAKIMEKINNGQLNSEYTFIHIPKSFSISEAVKEIGEMISVY